MIAFPVVFWLENGRVAAQSVWFSCFLLALWATLAAGYWPRQFWLSGAARWLWIVAMALIVGFWLGGATLEMTRRAAQVSGARMMVALAAFSGLLAGVLSLVREWLKPGSRAPFQAEKVAFSMLVFTVAGWWFGGLALEQNAVWFAGPALTFGANTSATAPLFPGAIPDGWALLLGGATLLGASRSVRPAAPNATNANTTNIVANNANARRVRNPRPASWWILGMALLLSWPLAFLGVARNAGAASVFVLAGAVFGLKVWRARPDCPRLCRAPLFARVLGVATLTMLPLLFGGATVANWSRNAGSAWHEAHQGAAWLLLIAGIAVLLTALREHWRLAVSDRFFERALAQGALAGFALASLIFGPGGALFWAFWPLCGAFFDLLTPRESNRRNFNRNNTNRRNSKRTAAFWRRPSWSRAPVAAELPAAELADPAPAP